MYSLRTFKQKRATNINWAKARLIGSLDAIAYATQLLDKHEVLVDDIDSNLVWAKVALEHSLEAWDKQIWEKLNDK